MFFIKRAPRYRTGISTGYPNCHHPLDDKSLGTFSFPWPPGQASKAEVSARRWRLISFTMLGLLIAHLTWWHWL